MKTLLIGFLTLISANSFAGVCEEIVKEGVLNAAKAINSNAEITLIRNLTVEGYPFCVSSKFFAIEVATESSESTWIASATELSDSYCEYNGSHIVNKD